LPLAGLSLDPWQSPHSTGEAGSAVGPATPPLRSRGQPRLNAGDLRGSPQSATSWRRQSLCGQRSGERSK